MGSELTRKLASIQKIEEIKNIEGADAIQAYRVLGWWVVDKKNAHKVGDLVVYIEIDSWVPHTLAPFLSKGSSPREYNGVKGERLRTIKLRGQVSQGLLLSNDVLDSYGNRNFNISVRNDLPVRWIADNYAVAELIIGEDLTEFLGIQKWEAPLSAQLQGKARGNFPTSLIPKTDQERIQSCFGSIQKRAKRFATEQIWNEELQILEDKSVVIPEDFQEPTYEVSMKLDGSSMTLFRWEGDIRVCSRNLELKIDDENKDNNFVAMALKIGDKIANGFAIQGELVGPSIQNNQEGFTEHKFFVFDIFDIRNHEYFDPERRREYCQRYNLDHVPILGTNWKAPLSIEEGLELATGPSINAKNREGIVYKCNEDPSFSFKIISNEWLLRNKE